LTWGQRIADIQKPGFLYVGDEDKGTWQVTQVQENIFSISYPDLTKDEMRSFATRNVRTLTETLEEFVLEAAHNARCNCVVLDCHGGPDNSSIAACLLADYSFLISEPDKITFYGTLNFKRQLDAERFNKPANVYLIFNKIVPAFSTFFLHKVYNVSIKKLFDGRPLLANFPLEVYLTKDFEKTPFLSNVYPNSLLARKTRLLLYEIFGQNHNKMLPKSILNMSWVMRFVDKHSLGKRWPVLNLDVVLPIIAFTFVILSTLYFGVGQVIEYQREILNEDLKRLEIVLSAEFEPEVLRSKDIRSFVLDGQGNIDSKRMESILQILREHRPEYFSLQYASWQAARKRIEYLTEQRYEHLEDRVIYDAAMGLVKSTNSKFDILQRISEFNEEMLPWVFAICGGSSIIWFVVVVLSNWLSTLRRRFYYFMRQRKWMGAFASGGVVLLLLGAIFGMVGSLTGSIVAALVVMESLGNFVAILTPIVLSGFVVFGVCFPQIRKGVREFRWDRRPIEGAFRIGFSMWILISFGLGWLAII
jgi:cellulose biosynthesis protein BcsQ